MSPPFDKAKKAIKANTPGNLTGVTLELTLRELLDLMIPQEVARELDRREEARRARRQQIAQYVFWVVVGLGALAAIVTAVRQWLSDGA